MKNTLRITSGTYRGREILTPGTGTHPMGSRERLALFNAISAYLPDAVVLDAFAGSGALGIEALSRGAKFVTFVEKSSAAARIIRENLTKLDLRESTEVVTGEIEKYSSERHFDLILADPPYDKFDISMLAGLVKILRNGGILVLSHPGAAPELEGLSLEKTATYAGAKISFYHKNA